MSENEKKLPISDEKLNDASAGYVAWDPSIKVDDGSTGYFQCQLELDTEWKVEEFISIAARYPLMIKLIAGNGQTVDAHDADAVRALPGLRYVNMFTEYSGSSPFVRETVKLWFC